MAWLVLLGIVLLAGYFLVGPASVGPARTIDLPVARFFARNRTGTLVDLANISLVVLVPFGLLALSRLWRPRATDIGRNLAVVTLAAATLAAYAEVFVAKQIIARPRPPRALAAIADTGYSFPSAHVTVATAGCVSVALLFPLAGRARRWVWVGVAGAVVVTAASRLVLGVHWLIDVLVGAALGSACAVAAVMLVAWGLSASSRRAAAAPDSRPPPAT